VTEIDHPDDWEAIAEFHRRLRRDFLDRLESEGITGEDAEQKADEYMLQFKM
jgi:hypothetical protein